MDALERAAEVLDAAAEIYARQQNGEGLLQVASMWVAVWERSAFPDEPRLIGFVHEGEDDE